MRLRNFSYMFIATSLFFSSACGAAQETVSPAQPAAQINETADQLATSATDNANIIKLPRIIDFGSKQCKACKAMEPVLESLKTNHADKFVTEFVDVWLPENETLAQKHSIESIPTQVFLDGEDKEIYRNTGFISEEDIIAKWKELGALQESSIADTEEETVPADEPATEE